MQAGPRYSAFGNDATSGQVVPQEPPGMPERNKEPRQLRLINAGELDDGVENWDDDIADESWESVMDNISRMIVRSGLSPDYGLGVRR